MNSIVLLFTTHTVSGRSLGTVHPFSVGVFGFLLFVQPYRFTLPMINNGPFNAGSNGTDNRTSNTLI